MHKYISTTGLQIAKLITVCLSGTVVAGMISSCCGQSLIAHWSLDEMNPPYSDSSLNGVILYQDPATTTAIAGSGMAGGSAQLNWQAVPGTSTRLFATNAALQTDSFGFSFWFNANYLNNDDDFIAKEMPYTTIVSGDQLIAWQVRVSGNNVGGSSPLEFIVRGNNPTNGSFFGNVFSSSTVPLFSSMTNWIHVAGGYNSASGALTLFVNGVQSTSTNGVPGAHSSDGSPFDIGTAKNGSNYVVFAAGAAMDDVQLYNAPPSASDVAFLMANPGQDVRPFYITQMTYDSTSGNITASVTSTNGPNQSYVVQASTNLDGFVAVTNVIPVGQNTVITLPKPALDGVFGVGARSSLFLNLYLLNSFTGCN